MKSILRNYLKQGLKKVARSTEANVLKIICCFIIL